MISNRQVSPTKNFFGRTRSINEASRAKISGHSVLSLLETNEIKCRKTKDNNYRLIKPKCFNRLTVTKLPLPPLSINKIFG